MHTSSSALFIRRLAAVVTIAMLACAAVWVHGVEALRPSIRGQQGELVISDGNNETTTLSALLARLAQLEGSASTYQTATLALNAQILQQQSQLVAQQQLQNQSLLQLSIQITQLSADNSRLAQQLSLAATDLCASSSNNSNSNNNNIRLFQSIPTVGASDWEFFTISGDNYLAVANFNNGSSFLQNSQIFKFDALSNRFVPFQSLPTVGAYDWKFFTITPLSANTTTTTTTTTTTQSGSGGSTSTTAAFSTTFSSSSSSAPSSSSTTTAASTDSTTTTTTTTTTTAPSTAAGTRYFLALASFSKNGNGSSIDYNTNSNIYIFNSTLNAFVLFQTIATVGAADWEFFTINGQNFLIVANGASSSSPVYRFDEQRSRFVLFQLIQTAGAMDWEHFVINNRHYLVVANENSTSSSNSTSRSQIFKYDETSTVFVLFQSLVTSSALEWRFFAVNNQSYLVAASGYNANAASYTANTQVYKFNNATQYFALWQNILTVGATDLGFFSINGHYYLAVAYWFDETRGHNISSQIFKFDAAGTQLFSPVAQIATVGARGLKYFSLNNNNNNNNNNDYNYNSQNYLAFANQHDSTFWTIDSPIFKFVSSCW